jgi:peptidoglycan/LPS O-acetylase OafA/YrhL
MPSVPLPRIMAAPIVTIAKSTLFIYLFHWPINVVAFRWLGIHGGPLGVIVGLIGGLAVWALYEALIKGLRSMRGVKQQTADVFG